MVNLGRVERARRQEGRIRGDSLSTPCLKFRLQFCMPVVRAALMTPRTAGLAALEEEATSQRPQNSFNLRRIQMHVLTLMLQYSSKTTMRKRR